MMSDRQEHLVDIFFYGLYMDASILAEYRVAWRDPQNAYAPKEFPAYHKRLSACLILRGLPIPESY